MLWGALGNRLSVKKETDREERYRKCLETEPIKAKLLVTVKGFELARMRGNDGRTKEMGLCERNPREPTQGLQVDSVADLCLIKWVSPSLPQVKPGAPSPKGLFKTGLTTS